MRRTPLVLHLPLQSVPLRVLLGHSKKLIELLLLSLIWPGLADDAFVLDDGLARYWGAIDVEGVSVAALARQCRLLDDHHLWVLGRAMVGAAAALAESVWAFRQSTEASTLRRHRIGKVARSLKPWRRRLRLHWLQVSTQIRVLTATERRLHGAGHARALETLRRKVLLEVLNMQWTMCRWLLLIVLVGRVHLRGQTRYLHGLQAHRVLGLHLKGRHEQGAVGRAPNRGSLWTATLATPIWPIRRRI